MSKIVYQCDYCFHTEKIEKDIDNHEKNCSCNPNIKKCGTCEHLNFEYGNTVCSEKNNNTYEYFDENKECPFHLKSKIVFKH